MRRDGPPVVAAWIFAHLVFGDRNDALSGDIAEEFSCGRSTGWYWRQVLSAVVIGCSGEISARSPALIFAALWMIPARAWCVLSLWDATHFVEQILPWPYSSILGMAASVVLSLWAGLIVYGLIYSFIGHNLRPESILRGFLIGPLAFLIMTVAVRILSRPLGIPPTSLGGFSFLTCFPSLVVTTWEIRSRTCTPKVLICFFIFASLRGSHLTAQTAQPGVAPETTPSFDVVSIRENKSDNMVRDYGVTANGYHMRGTAPFLLLITAFAPSDGKASLFNPDQIVSVPDWMMQTSYDVEAKVAEQDLAAWKRPETQRAMLQQVLEDRFKLVDHREYRQIAVYNMVIAKGGLKFKASQTTDMDVIRKAYPTASALPGGVVLVRGSKPGETMLFGATTAELGIFFGKGMGRPIEDKTGLAGKYDITLALDFSPGPDGARPDPVPVVMSALQEQLGLKLEPAKENVEVLVIDHIEKPSAN